LKYNHLPINHYVSLIQEKRIWLIRKNVIIAALPEVQLQQHVYGVWKNARIILKETRVPIFRLPTVDFLIISEKNIENAKLIRDYRQHLISEQHVFIQKPRRVALICEQEVDCMIGKRYHLYLRLMTSDSSHPRVTHSPPYPGIEDPRIFTVATSGSDRLKNILMNKNHPGGCGRWGINGFSIGGAENHTFLITGTLCEKLEQLMKPL
jgi:hypothetical protein